METRQLDITTSATFVELDAEELLSITGGSESRSFWGDVVYFAAATARCIYEFSKQAVEYQHSLPAHLKK